MSHHAYRVSAKLAQMDPPFEALIMAALRRADSGNAERIRAAWPEIADEAQARYDAPAGVLATDPDAVETLARMADPDAFDSTRIDAHSGEELYRQHRRNSARTAARERLGFTETAAGS